MTVIAAMGCEMAADTSVWAGGTVVAMTMRKITRLSDGSLVGTCGSPGFGGWFVEWLDAQILSGRPSREWTRDNQPEIGEDGFGAIWLRTDQKRYRFNYSTFPSEETGSFSVTGGNSISIVVGALAAGASVSQAIQIAIRYGDAAAGDVQLERLNGVPSAIIEGSPDELRHLEQRMRVSR